MQLRSKIHGRVGLLVWLIFFGPGLFSSNHTHPADTSVQDGRGNQDHHSTENGQSALQNDDVRPDQSVPPDSANPSFYRKQPNRAFEVGEHLVFDIAYGAITAGTATMSVADTQRVNGRLCYRAVTTARSSDFFDKIYRVRDQAESLIDREGLFSWKFDKRINEGKLKRHKWAIFDQDDHVVYTQKDTLAIPEFAQDILCSFYYARTVPLRVGQSFEIDSYNDGKVYSLRILVHAKDRVKVPAGQFKCIVVEPVLKGEGLFSQKGRLAIWLTDDERRIPVLMKSKILVGSIDARLRSISNKHSGE